MLGLKSHYRKVGHLLRKLGSAMRKLVAKLMEANCFKFQCIATRSGIHTYHVAQIKNDFDLHHFALMCVSELGHFDDKNVHQTAY